MRYALLAVVAITLAVLGARLALSSPGQQEPPPVQSRPDPMPTDPPYFESSIGPIPCAVFPNQEPGGGCMPDANYLFGPEGPPPTPTPESLRVILERMPGEKRVLLGGRVMAVIGWCRGDAHAVDLLRDPANKCLAIYDLADASVVTLSLGGEIVNATYGSGQGEIEIGSILNDAATKGELLEFLREAPPRTFP